MIAFSDGIDHDRNGFANDIVGCKCHRHSIRMARGLLVDTVNQVHCALRVMAFKFRFHPDGKELRAEISGFDLLQIDVACRNGRVLADIEVLVQKPLWRIRMGIDNQGGLVDRLWRVLLRLFLRRGGLLRALMVCCFRLC